jgi:hypothetical protein
VSLLREFWRDISPPVRGLLYRIFRRVPNEPTQPAWEPSKSPINGHNSWKVPSHRLSKLDGRTRKRTPKVLRRGTRSERNRTALAEWDYDE